MELVKLDISKAGVDISADMKKQTMEANALLHSGKGAGNDFLGWVHLPSSISEADIAAIEAEAAKLLKAEEEKKAAAPAPAPAPTPEDVVLLREIRDLLKSSAASNAEVKAAVEKLQQK